MERRQFLLLFAASGASATLADPPEIHLEDIVQQGRELVEDVDPNLLRQVDTAMLQQWLRELQARLQGEYVIDLSQLGAAARTLVPILDGLPEYKPYGLWLRTRLDYFDVAEELRLVVPPAGSIPNSRPRPPGGGDIPAPVPQAPRTGVPSLPAPKSATPPAQRTEPPAELQRLIWRRQVQAEPAPVGAQEYVARLRPIFSAQGTPTPLVWLAEVESSFEPSARSPGGAVGLYQLTPTAAKEEGLSLWPRDERLNPEKSARAAAARLHRLHAQFSDWRLAVAAYNAGSGRVKGLLERSRTQSFDAIAHRLPAETQLYVPKVEATLQRRAGVPLERLTAG